MQFSVAEAQAHFEDLLAYAEACEEVVITDGPEGRPMARMVRCEPEVRPSRLGWFKGELPDLGPDDPFWDPLPEEELRLWNGEGD